MATYDFDSIPRIDELNETNIDVKELEGKSTGVQILYVANNGMQYVMRFTLTDATMGKWNHGPYGNWSALIRPSEADRKEIARVEDIIRKKAIAVCDDDNDREIRRIQLKNWSMFPSRPVPVDKLADYQKYNTGATTYPPSSYVSARESNRESESGVTNAPDIQLFDANGNLTDYMEYKDWNRQKMSKISIVFPRIYEGKEGSKKRWKSSYTFQAGKSADSLGFATVDRSNTSAEEKKSTAPESNNTTTNKSESAPQAPKYKSQLGKRSATQAGHSSTVSTSKRTKTKA